ncbi:tenascin-like isoform X2 [Ostrea edulis]|uniref:tenascin-like isoform X2 n=1 Tax=Ostrea edulis TaxID=37623 RepID=UPI0024AFE2DF|nr:tenascin-like isoform X2 [Ostrea edulis]
MRFHVAMWGIYHCCLSLLIGFTVVEGLCHDNHCHHLCPSGKYSCLSHDHLHNHGCECFPADHCDDTDYPCSPLQCPHNELTRCSHNNKCECYCNRDSQCQNCPEQGFCVNEKCVCESNDYCPHGNPFYCYKHFNCPHNESKRCNGDRCECYCDLDSDCKNCPEKGFCVDGNCVCESHDYCPKGNHLYCSYMHPICGNGFTAKCNSTNHCYCAYVPDTCSEHDVSKCFHLTCQTGEKKYCNGRTCVCKPLDYCQQNDADCGHKNCVDSLGQVKGCIDGLCQCLDIPDFCGGNDVSTCQHLKCNQYQVKICDHGLCKCQVNPSCDANQGLNDTCTMDNTVLEVKTADGTIRYDNCTSGNHYPLCVDGRCHCIFWKTPPPLLNVSSSTAKITATTPILATTPVGTTQAVVASTPALASTATVATTTATGVFPNVSSSTAATCSSRSDCNSMNTYLEFPFHMPCPPDHINCINNMCICSLEKITTTPPPTTTAAPSVSCHQCGDPSSNTPCDLRDVYMGNPSPCTSGSYCMTDVVQGADDSVAIYKRCVDELTCRNEWLAQTSDQDRCLKYAEGALPGKYTCHYCCTADGCNSKVVPESKYFYTALSSTVN